MRLLITGGSSYLGRHLVPRALNQKLTVAYTYYRNRPELPGEAIHLDLRDRAQVHSLLSRWKPDAVIHLAGSNRGDDLEGVIVGGSRNLGDALEEQVRLIHLSTDVIFDGLAAPYKEEDTPNPLHLYGRCKAQAELLVARHPNQVTVRTSLIYGLEQPDRGTEAFLARLAAGEKITLFNNQYRNPIWVDSLCEACLELLSLAYCGPLHVAGAEGLDRASYGLALLSWWGAGARDLIQVAPDESGRFPADTRLDIGRARRLLRTPLPGFHKLLAKHK